MLKWILVAVALVLAPVARADDDPNKAAAQAAYHDGETAYDKGDFPAALTAFQHAYDLAPIPALLFNMAQCYRKLNDHAHALDTLEKYQQLEKNVPAQRRKELKSQLASEKKAVAADDKKVADAQKKADADAKKAAADAQKRADADAKKAGTKPVAVASAATPATAPTTPATPAPSGSDPAASFISTPTTPAPLTPAASTAEPATSAPAVKESHDGPFWTNPVVIGVVVGAAVLVAGGTAVALVDTAPGPTPPHTSLGTVDLRKP